MQKKDKNKVFHVFKVEKVLYNIFNFSKIYYCFQRVEINSFED